MVILWCGHMIKYWLEYNGFRPIADNILRYDLYDIDNNMIWLQVNECSCCDIEMILMTNLHA
jgi:hypothetical protein